MLPASSPPQESGLSAWIGRQLHPLENVPPVLAVLLITVVVAFFTEFASNTATIIIFLPVLAELVRVLGYWVHFVLGWEGNTPPQHRFRNPFLAPGSCTGGHSGHLLSSKTDEIVRTMFFFLSTISFSLRNV